MLNLNTAHPPFRDAVTVTVTVVVLMLLDAIEGRVSHRLRVMRAMPFYTPLALILLSEQVLTHTREKLRFYEKSNKVSQVRLTELEEKTLCLRGEVSSCKQLRDATRDEKKELKVRQGFANNELLINDFENRKRDILCTADRIADLQSRHHSLSLLVASFPPAPVAFPAHSSSSSTLRGGSSGNVQDTHTRTNTRSPLALL